MNDRVFGDNREAAAAQKPEVRVVGLVEIMTIQETFLMICFQLLIQKYILKTQKRSKAQILN